MNQSIEIVIVRHGEAACNVAGIVAGEKGCTGLTVTGRAQTERLAARLTAEHAIRPRGAAAQYRRLYRHCTAARSGAGGLGFDRSYRDPFMAAVMIAATVAGSDT
ncbi:histidine phosphatase family protein [Frankia sp. Cr2]|uniref:histidine phosphatase family protein n=1 Tax=Frankia sp. Cr2 TaxID=3073932 RepID=UPI002AD49F06|nr:histidine phosphatase family protein [Frankia sp. Cr2]